jgi:hypothetical protein
MEALEKEQRELDANLHLALRKSKEEALPPELLALQKEFGEELAYELYYEKPFPKKVGESSGATGGAKSTGEEQGA